MPGNSATGWAYARRCCSVRSGSPSMALPWVFPGLPALYAAGALIGACHVFYNVAVQNLIGLLSSDKTRTRNYSNFTLVISVSGMLGPLAAGFSIDHFG